MCNKYCSKIKKLNRYNNSLNTTIENLRWDMWRNIANPIKNLIGFSFSFSH